MLWVILTVCCRFVTKQQVSNECVAFCNTGQWVMIAMSCTWFKNMKFLIMQRKRLLTILLPSVLVSSANLPIILCTLYRLHEFFLLTYRPASAEAVSYIWWVACWERFLYFKRLPACSFYGQQSRLLAIIVKCFVTSWSLQSVCKTLYSP